MPGTANRIAKPRLDTPLLSRSALTGDRVYLHQAIDWLRRRLTPRAFRHGANAECFTGTGGIEVAIAVAGTAVVTDVARELDALTFPAKRQQQLTGASRAIWNAGRDLERPCQRQVAAVIAPRDRYRIDRTAVVMEAAYRGYS